MKLFKSKCVFPDSSSNGSPRRQKRPVSIVGDAINNALPSIRESTELVSLNGGKPQFAQWSNGVVVTNNNHYKNCSSTTIITPTNNGRIVIENPNRFDPSIVNRAEHLLGKCSLDGPDVTITSLTFIDAADYQNSITNCSSSSPRNNMRTIQDFFLQESRKHSLKSPPPLPPSTTELKK